MQDIGTFIIAEIKACEGDTLDEKTYIAMQEKTKTRQYPVLLHIGE